MRLLTSLDWVRNNTSMSDNLSDKYLRPAVFDAQETYYKKIIGTNLYEKLQELVQINAVYDNDEYTIYKELLDKSQFYIAFQTLAILTVTSTYKFANVGLHYTQDDQVYTPSIKDVFQLKNYYQNRADSQLDEIQNFLKEHWNEIPELKESNSYKTAPTVNTQQNTCSIFLGGKRGKISD